jgi:hypothetical protein
MATSGEFYSPFKGRFVPSDDMAEIGSAVNPVKNITATALTTATLAASGAATVGGALTVTGALTAGSLAGPIIGPVFNALASTTLTGTHVGGTVIAPVDGAYTLPAAASFPGGRITVITGAASAGTGVRLTRAGADTIEGKTTVTGTALTGNTTYTNSGASDVVGDSVTLVSDGVSKWWMVAQSGTWA